MENRITLAVRDGTWHATFTDPEIRRLFGTDTLPTPYTSRAPAETVLAEVSRRNPDSVVTLGQ